MSVSKPGPNLIYEIKVTLRWIEPSLWRRLKVPASIPLARLHELLQAAMGWTNKHSHLFDKDGTLYGTPADAPPDAAQPADESETSLQDVLQEVGQQMVYVYDFRDSWEHDVVLEKSCLGEAADEPPVCLDGERCCPPEDVGGASGYQEFLEVIFDSQHEMHAYTLEWAGGCFQPDEFDLNRVNSVLAARWKSR